MKKKLIALSLFAASTGVFAQANPFEGFSAGVNVSSVGASSSLSTADGFSTNLGQQSVVPTIEAGYTFGISKEFALGITATYDLSDTKMGSVDGLNFKGKNHYSINLKPGYVISNTMVYAILGYNGVKGTANYDGLSASQNFNGFGGGIGIAVMLDKNIFVKAEAQQVTYGSKTSDGLTFKPSTTVGTVGIGYRF